MRRLKSRNDFPRERICRKERTLRGGSFCQVEYPTAVRIRHRLIFNVGVGGYIWFPFRETTEQFSYLIKKGKK